MNNLTTCINGSLHGEAILIKELSFYEYRSLVKRLLTDDIIALDRTFNSLFTIVNGYWSFSEYDIVKKFNTLLQLRSVILSPIIEMSVNDAQINYPISEILKIFNAPFKTFNYSHDGHQYEFGLPSSFIPYSNPIDFVTNCLQSIDGETTEFNLNELPALPVNEITQSILKFYEELKITLPHINQEINPFDGSMLIFLKSIFMYNIKDLYNIEYALRRNLNFQSDDLKTLSLPECNILLRQYNEEIKQNDKQVES